MAAMQLALPILLLACRLCANTTNDLFAVTIVTDFSGKVKRLLCDFAGFDAKNNGMLFVQVNK